MCGRFVSVSPPDEVARYFDAEPTAAVLEPSWNVAPTDDAYVVLEEGGVRRLAAHHWGLVPFWAKDPSVGSRMINARAEGLADKGAFKTPTLRDVARTGPQPDAQRLTSDVHALGQSVASYGQTKLLPPAESCL